MGNWALGVVQNCGSTERYGMIDSRKKFTRFQTIFTARHSAANSGFHFYSLVQLVSGASHERSWGLGRLGVSKIDLILKGGMKRLTIVPHASDHQDHWVGSIQAKLCNHSNAL